MTTQEKVIKWFYLKEIPTRAIDDQVIIYIDGLSLQLSTSQEKYIAEMYDDKYGSKTNSQIIDDISDAIVYISRNMHHFQGDESDLREYKDMLTGLSQAMNLIKQL